MGIQLYATPSMEGPFEKLKVKYARTSVVEIAVAILEKLQEDSVAIDVLKDASVVSRHFEVLRACEPFSQRLFSKTRPDIKQQLFAESERYDAKLRELGEASLKYILCAPKEGLYASQDRFLKDLLVSPEFVGATEVVVNEFLKHPTLNDLERIRLFEKGIAEGVDKAVEKLKLKIPDGAPFLRFVAFFVAALNLPFLEERSLAVIDEWFSVDALERDFPEFGVLERDYQTYFAFVHNAWVSSLQLGKCVTI